MHNAQSYFPIVFTFANAYIGIFPAFYSVDRHATIPQATAQFFHDRYRGPSARRSHLYIYLIDYSDMASVYALTKEMTVKFPLITSLHLWFERQCDIVSF